MNRVAVVLAVLLMSPLIMGASCGKGVRDVKTYKSEVKLDESMALEQSKNLVAWVGKSCQCNADKTAFIGDNAKLCNKSADDALVAKHRAPWHAKMKIYLARVIEERPPKTPPKVPPATSLCPDPPPPAPAPEPTPTTPPEG